MRSLPLLLLSAFPLQAAPTFEKEVRPVLEELCVRCHGPEKDKGDIRFDQLNPDLVNGPDAETWHDALDQLNLGEMPPPKEEKQPTKEQRALLVEWMTAELRKAGEAKRFADGRVTTRRLTRYEYANTMRDLLGVYLDFARDLPPEPASPEGFLNNGLTLEMSPTQIETYLEVARKALAEAIVTGEQPEVFEYAQTETTVGKLPNKKVAGHLPVNPEFAIDVSEYPRSGTFEIEVRAKAAIPEGNDIPRMRVSMGHVPGIVHVPHVAVGEVDVPDKPTTFTFRGRMEDYPQAGDIPFGNSGFKGMIVFADFLDADGKELRYPDRSYVVPKPAPKKGEAPKEVPPPKPFGSRLDIEIESFEFKAPVYASWPPPSHKALLFESEENAREILKRFMTRAYRRPVRGEELNQTTRLFEMIRPDAESFEEAVRETFAAVLVSPHFLYLVEEKDPKAKAETLTDHELASRLSYFLWSSMPDERLFELAGKRELRKPKVLEAEIARMLADERSSEFVTRFADQWFDLDGLHRVAVNPEYFPDWDESLKEEMRKETHAYFAEIVRGDRSALELIDSDWAMLNRTLAKHYGIEGPRSSKLERVSLKADQHRGGLLGQGAFLLANSNGEDSHPIKRAVWILDRLMDSPPAPPPPDVPDLDTANPDMAKLTLKEQLAVHREKESCANCHQGIDPWGIPFENYDAIGRWRTEIPKVKNVPAKAVDTESVLPDGTEIANIQALKRYLLEGRKRYFARSVVKRLMAYGLGRSLDLGDRVEVEALAKEFEKDGFRMKRLISAFVQSKVFLTK